MERKLGKYVVTVHPEYLGCLYERYGCQTSEDEDNINRKVIDSICNFLQGGKDIFIVEGIEYKGKHITPITFSPIPNLAYMKRLSGRKAKGKRRKR